MHSLVTDHLYIGDARAAMAPDVERFKTIVNVTREVPFSKVLAPGVETTRFDVLDEGAEGEQEAMSALLPEAARLIEKSLRADKNTLVHCLEGSMRSATVVAGYYMICQGLDLESSKMLICSAHPPAFDGGRHSHFEPALLKLDRKLTREFLEDYYPERLEWDIYADLQAGHTA